MEGKSKFLSILRGVLTINGNGGVTHVDVIFYFSFSKKKKKDQYQFRFPKRNRSEFPDQRQNILTQ